MNGSVSLVEENEELKEKLRGSQQLRLQHLQLRQLMRQARQSLPALLSHQPQVKVLVQQVPSARSSR